MFISKLKKLIVPLLSVLFVSAFPVLFLYFTNAGEANFSEAARPLLLFVAVGIVLFAVIGLFMKSAGKASLVACVFMLVLTNFALLEKLLKAVIPALRYWHTVPIFLVLCVFIAFLIHLYLPKKAGRDASGILCLVFGVLIAINAITGTPKLIAKLNAEKAMAAAKEEAAATLVGESEDLPNVYYLLFDEYAGFEQMKTYYHYDNAELEDFLLENGFSISYDSRNESIMTTTITTNLMNLDYVVDNYMSNEEKEPIRKQGKLFSVMREHGYDVRILETDTFFGDEPFDGKGSGSGGLTVGGENLEFLCYQKTVIYPFYTVNTPETMDKILGVVNYMASEEMVPQKPTFTLGYLIFPHTPFLVDEKGNALPFAKRVEWNDNKYYLGQYKYCTTLMLDVLENILKNDPDSIIILQSDHGARASTGRTLFFKKFPMEAMNNPLNAVYYRGEPIDEIKGLSGVNTLRTVLSRLYGEEYPLLPVPADTYDYLK